MERNPHGRPGLHGQRSHKVLSPCHCHVCKHTRGYHSETGTMRCLHVGLLPTRDDMHVNTARITLFSQMSGNIENIPPTQATLDQHIKRSSYQSEHEQSVEVQPELPDVTGWGWETPQTAGYVPTWTTLCIAKVACLELIACTCAKYCNGNFNGFKADLGCTALC